MKKKSGFFFPTLQFWSYVLLQNLGGDEAVNPGPNLKKEVVQEEEEEEEEELDLPLVNTQPYTLPNTPSSARTDPQSSGGQ